MSCGCPSIDSFLNAIERFWLQLKTLVAANRLHRDWVNLLQVIEETIRPAAGC